MEPFAVPLTPRPELNSTSPVPTQIKDKKGRSTSCYLCQKRKQKCDQRSPSCTNCIKTQTTCIQPPRYGTSNKANVKSEYTIFLEKKVQRLERLLETHPREENGEASTKYRKIRPLLNPHEVQPSVNRFYSAVSKPYDEFLLEFADNYNSSMIARFRLQEFFKKEPVFDVDAKLAKHLVDIYFALLQYKFPALNEQEVLRFQTDYYNGIQPRSEDDYHFGCARMFLVYSLSSMLHETTGKYKGPEPLQYFSSALRHIVLMKNALKLQKIELLMLLSCNLIRTDKDSNGLYDVICESMSLCIELKLEKTASYRNIPPAKKDRQMRLFWCCYLLEKAIAVAVSKPFVLRESETDRDLPVFEYEPSKAMHPTDGPFFINQIIKIRRTEARFIEQLNILGSTSITTKDQLPAVEQFFQELQTWRNECHGFTRGIENETLNIYYYRSVRNLIQPFLELLDPEDRLFKECQAAAGQICQSIKAFHQKTIRGFSLINVHTTFIAGVTLIYCLWLHRNRDDMRRKLLGDDKKHTRPVVSETLFAGLDDLRACSISLYVMSERTKFALSFRETFEELMHATIGNLILRCGPDSSEVSNHPPIAMPPATMRKPLQHYTVESELNMKPTDADRREEEEMSKRRGQLTRSTIPKGLNHLLIHSPPLPAQNSYLAPHVASSPSSLRSTASALTEQPITTASISSPQPLKLLPTGETYSPQPMPQPMPQPYMAPPFNSVQNIPEMMPFVGRTTAMINNISVWTGESGQQIPQTGLSMMQGSNKPLNMGTQLPMYDVGYSQPDDMFAWPWQNDQLPDAGDFAFLP
ncbi:hypothetical protein OGAPHI_007174 [Ogataea philodendri]|uniref:Zn(2)-C6 fungal-type domain-containing protein n=1 Tax=Ogataea philodendri TaxID=1378263 RepID=A0A9P8NVT9_9ASCO|nr:uncharacterized protein OGAPHI_007174 [Ogataea philodendri]KAH3659969.1 hypothetical protein OGAPHI_007174 [Ogataea philodendri]